MKKKIPFVKEEFSPNKSAYTWYTVQIIFMQNKKKESLTKKSIDPVLSLEIHIAYTTRWQILVYALFLVFVIIGIASVKRYLLPQSPTLVESEQTEQKVIPKDVKKQLDTNQQQASLSATIRVPILMYHYVEFVADKKDTTRQSLNIMPPIFDQQMKTLHDAGYTFLYARDMGEILDGKQKLPKKPILITIDDGHWDLQTDILPILKKYHVKATAYIIAGFLGGSDFLSDKQLKDVISSGIVEIGAHTVNHISLKDKPKDLVTEEVVESKKVLEKQYHLSVVSFAYPNGSFDEQAITAVKTAGYTTAVSTIPGIEQNQNNRFFLYRIRPGGRTGQDLLTYLDQVSFTPW